MARITPYATSRTLLPLLFVTAVAPAIHAQCGELAKLTAPNAAADDLLGVAVDVSGTTIVAGANHSPAAVAFGGAAWIFDLGVSGWSETQELTASDAEVGDFFGTAVALENDTLFVSATGDDDLGASAGAVYVFERTTSGWTEMEKLHAFDGAGGDAFGAPVVLQGNLALMAAPSNAFGAGAVYIFERNASGWSSVTKLTDAGGHDGDRFGTAMAISDRTMAVGAPRADDGCPLGADCNTGTVLLFERTGTGWVQTAELNAPTPAFDDEFGTVVAIDGDTLFVGAPGDDGGCTTPPCDQGAVYVFERTATTWNLTAELRAKDAIAGNAFGTTVALDGDRAVIGAPRVSDEGTLAGAYYRFERRGGEWVQVEKLTTSDAEAFDGVGSRLALEDATLLLGVPYSSNRAGAAYVVGLPEVGTDGPPGNMFCFGNGVEALCPCGNATGTGEGCAHSAGRGMEISVCGTTSVSADDLVVTALHCPPGNAGRFFAGNTALMFGGPAFDGLVCLSGEGRRFQPLFQVDGSASDTGFVAQDPSGTYFQPGSTVIFQYWCRDVAGGPSPCGTGANLSPAFGTTLTP